MFKSFIAKKIDFLELIIIFFYYFTTVSLILGLVGFFERWLLLLSIILFILIIAFLKIKITFERYYFIILILIPLSLIGFALLRGFFNGDALTHWLPISREIATLKRVPAFIPAMGETPLYRQPLLYLLIASTFSVAEATKQLLAIWIPLLFSSLTILFFYKWAKEKNINSQYLIFIVFLFVSNRLVDFWGWNLMQESLILFFSTAFFYYYEKYWHSLESGDQAKVDNYNLFFILLSFSLACLTKELGFFLFIPLFFLFLKSKGQRKKFIILATITATPVIIWLIRNYLFFSDPIFPLLKGIFSSPYHKYYLSQSVVFKLFGTPELQYSFWLRPVHDLGLFISAFPWLLLSLWGLMKDKKIVFILTLFIFYIIQLTLMYAPLNADRRMYMFLGLLLVYAGLGLQYLKSKLFIYLLSIAALAGLLTTPLIHSTSSFISGLESKFNLFIKPVEFFHGYPLLTLLLLTPFVLYLIFKDHSKFFLLTVYCLYILQLRWVANKSWLNAWLPILAVVLFLLFYPFIKRIKFFEARKFFIVFIAVVLFLNSWGMAILYYWNQGNLELPISQPYVGSFGIVNYLDENETSPKDSYFILARDIEYLVWYAGYQGIRLNLYDFNFLTSLSYNDDLSAEEIYNLFKASKIKYIAINNYELADDIIILDNKIKNNPDLFNEVYSEPYKNEGEFRLYQVY